MAKKIRIRKKKKKDGYVRVRDLKVILDELDDDRVVILSKDGEGNCYSPLDCSDMFIGKYEPYSEAHIWTGEIGHECLTKEMISDGYTDEDVLENGEPCVVFYPI